MAEDQIPNMTEINKDELAAATRSILKTLGEDPSREGLEKTPERVARALEFLTQGYRMDPEAILSNALFEHTQNDMVIVKDIELYSLCEHHMLPFFGKCHVGYIPNGKIVGVSKIPRIVDAFSRRLQVQERLTTQISDVLNKYLNPRGVAVVIEAKHLCMMMRGVEKQNSEMQTSSMVGIFREQAQSRMEFLELIGRKNG